MERKGQLRGQSAIEYLITYGWMVIALVAIVGALFYLGVLSPSSWFATSNDVTGLATFTVTDYTVTPGGYMTIYLKSGAGARTSVTAIKIRGQSLTGVSPTVPITVNPGQNVTITGTAGNFTGNSGDSFYNTNIEIMYDVVGGGSNHTDSGVMRGRFS